MKTKHFKSALTNSVLSIEILKDFWSMFPDLYKYDDPKKAFNYANSENFKDNIFEFEPQLVPYSDYDVQISKYEITEKYFRVTVDKIIDDENKNSINFDGCLSFVNGVKKKLVNPKEYSRLVIIHVMTNPVVQGKPKFVISNALSEPKLYAKNKKRTFSIPVSEELNKEFNSYKYHRTYAFFVNFFTEIEENDNGESITIENVISCSDVYPMNSMLLEDSDIEIKFPPHFED
jgi:hypothetical protein